MGLFIIPSGVVDPAWGKGKPPFSCTAPGVSPSRKFSSLGVNPSFWRSSWLVALSNSSHMWPGVSGLPGDNPNGGNLRPPGVNMGGVIPGNLFEVMLRMLLMRKLCLLDFFWAASSPPPSLSSLLANECSNGLGSSSNVDFSLRLVMAHMTGSRAPRAKRRVAGGSGGAGGCGEAGGARPRPFWYLLRPTCSIGKDIGGDVNVFR